jgi:hypothetical protein
MSVSQATGHYPADGVTIWNGFPQTYENETLIREGDKIHFQKSGGLLPGYTMEGVAAFCPHGSEGTLYLAQQKKDYISYTHIDHGGKITLIEGAS